MDESDGAAESDGADAPAVNRRIWFTPRALKLHAVILIVVPGFMALCIWQLYRALGGNELSWAYVFEWPFFAAYAVYMWWRFVHEAPDASAAPVAAAAAAAAAAAPVPAASPTAAAPQPEPAPTSAEDSEDSEDSDEAELAAYNEYLAQLAARDKAAGR
jgi:pyruvate/2-oxoglutarate dehydrogenase complex dihydrolipoamide acyltransferase (E2) component